MSTIAPARSTVTLVDRLQAQWDGLRTDARAVDHAQRWFPGVESLDDVLALVGFRGARDDDHGDGRLLHLVEVAAHDDLAARVVLQRILPGLISVAVRRGRMLEGRTAGAFSDVVAAAWPLIRSYPVDRRPRHVAANLLRDAEYETFVRQQRRRWSSAEVSVGVLPEPERPADEHGVVLVVEVLRMCRDMGIPRHDLRLLAELASGRTPDEIGAALGVSGRTVRTRRSDLARTVRDAMAGHDVVWPTAGPVLYRRWS